MCPGPRLKKTFALLKSNTYLSPGSLFNPRHKRNRSIFYADEILARHMGKLLSLEKMLVDERGFEPPASSLRTR
jgi:hypothetical protein